MSKGLTVILVITCLIVGFVAYSYAYQLGLNDGNSKGYSAGLIDGAGSGFTIRDPTLQEALNFVSVDKTETRKYVMASGGGYEYNCFNYCHDFLENAFGQGFKAGLVYVEFAEGAHAVVCFDTVDKGLIYVEPQNDVVVDLKVGEAYEFVEAPNTVERFTIIW
jgi:hypothetical protein